MVRFNQPSWLALEVGFALAPESSDVEAKNRAGPRAARLVVVSPTLVEGLRDAREGGRHRRTGERYSDGERRGDLLGWQFSIRVYGSQYVETGR